MVQEVVQGGSGGSGWFRVVQAMCLENHRRGIGNGTRFFRRWFKVVQGGSGGGSGGDTIYLGVVAPLNHRVF